MLWKKGWYETRTRLLVVLAVVVVITVLTMDPAPAAAGSGPVVAVTMIPAMLAALLLPGAGVKTQLGGLQRSKGLHGSMYYTLSLPVTRTRLFNVRVSLGLAETAVIQVLTYAAIWLVHAAIGPNATPSDMFKPTPSDMFKHVVAASFCVTAVYSLGVFFAAFLDEVYQHWATIFTVVGTIVILNRVPIPASMDAFLVLSLASPLNTHTMPWIAMAVLLGLSGMLLLIALKMVRSLEY
jgi:hypothetical protein